MLHTGKLYRVTNDFVNLHCQDPRENRWRIEMEVGSIFMFIEYDKGYANQKQARCLLGDKIFYAQCIMLEAGPADPLTHLFESWIELAY